MKGRTACTDRNVSLLLGQCWGKLLCSPPELSESCHICCLLKGTVQLLAWLMMVYLNVSRRSSISPKIFLLTEFWITRENTRVRHSWPSFSFERWLAAPLQSSVGPVILCGGCPIFCIEICLPRSFQSLFALFREWKGRLFQCWSPFLGISSVPYRWSLSLPSNRWRTFHGRLVACFRNISGYLI